MQIAARTWWTRTKSDSAFHRITLVVVILWRVQKRVGWAGRCGASMWQCPQLSIITSTICWPGWCTRSASTPTDSRNYIRTSPAPTAASTPLRTSSRESSAGSRAQRSTATICGRSKQAPRSRGRGRESFPGPRNVSRGGVGAPSIKNIGLFALCLTTEPIIGIEHTSVGGYFATIKKQIWLFLEWTNVFSIPARFPDTTPYRAPLWFSSGLVLNQWRIQYFEMGDGRTGNGVGFKFHAEMTHFVQNF